MIDSFLSFYKDNEQKANTWFESLSTSLDLPVYTSVDIRDSGYKASSIDTNLFPAGFNNLCHVSIRNAVEKFKTAILSKASECKHILIICEEHTRNKWYLENIYTLDKIANDAGFQTTIATFMSAKDLEDLSSDCFTLTTALDHQVTIQRLRPIIDAIKLGQSEIDLIILNNDLTSGIPDELIESELPIYPSPLLGWHRRKKSNHFKYFNQLTVDLFDHLGCLDRFDPWILTTLYEDVDSIDINLLEDREKLYQVAVKLFANIQEYYDKHSITKKPYLFLKANSGTYGMGVVAIHAPEDILDLNRKARNKLFKGKSSVPITSYILQEGVYSNLTVSNQSAEMVVYSIHNQPVGSFYRINSKKSDIDNLNSTGMYFEPVCLEPSDLVPLESNTPYDCGPSLTSDQLLLYALVSKLAGLAATFEKKDLK